METTTEQWGKRLRRDQPANVFFIDDELRVPLRAAAEHNGISVAGLIKKIVKAWLNDYNHRKA